MAARPSASAVPPIATVNLGAWPPSQSANCRRWSTILAPSCRLLEYSWPKRNVNDQLTFRRMTRNVPLPVVSSASTTLPAGRRRTSASLVSNSTSPVSQRTSNRCGGLCQSTSRIPAGTWQMLNQDAARLSVRRSGGLSLKSFFGCKATMTSSMCVSPSSSAKIRRQVTRSSVARSVEITVMRASLAKTRWINTSLGWHPRSRPGKANLPLITE